MPPNYTTPRTCTKCNEPQPLSNYSVGSGGYVSSWCKTCRAANTKAIRSRDLDAYRLRQKLRSQQERNLYPHTMRSRVNDWHDSNPTKSLEYKRKTKYGVTSVILNQMIQEQDNSCAICHCEFDKACVPHVDHNHSTNQHRGLLCKLCNTGIGVFKENPDHLRSAIKYLKNGVRYEA